MAKTLKVTIKPDGKMVFNFQGYEGQECYAASERLQEALKKFGLEPEVKHIEPHRDELQMRELENEAETGVGG